MSWVAVIIMCMTPVADSCFVINLPDPFTNEMECKEEVLAGVDYFTKQNTYARGKCIKINSTSA
jgi:hypothetical protein